MNSATEQRKLAAIMFTDMVGYSALAQRSQALALELLEEHRALLRAVFPRFNGTEIKTIGDAFLVEFHSALEAAQCGIEIQRALAKRNADASGERQVQIRIGIHIGDVVHREGDVYGDGVNIASRIEPLAGAGGICVSMDVERQIRNALEARFEKLGPTELKNISVPMELFRIVLPWETQRSSRRESAHGEPGARNAERETEGQSRLTSAATKFGWVAVFVLLAVAVGWWLVHRWGPATKSIAQSTTNSPTAPTASSAAPAADQKSIAVLPFVNMSADKDNEYFSDGITEEILNALARTPGLRVAARTSAFSFKGKNETVQRIGEALKVGVVLEGSVRRAGNQLRITVQLIHVADGFHLWSDAFDRKAEDVFAIQTEVAQRVQEVLKVKLLAGGSPNATLAGTDDLEAYDLYLRARYFWNLRTGADAQRAVGLFQQATEKDPKFAAAYAALGSSYVLLPQYAAVPMRETNPKAQAAARRALELDSRLAEAHAVLGHCAWKDWDRVAAEREYREALRLHPNHSTTHHWYALLLRDQGRTDQALAEIRKAKALDPLSAVIQDNIGEHLYFAGRYEEALAEFDTTLKLSPDFLLAYNGRGRTFLVQNRIPEAIAEFEKVREKTPDTPFALGELGLAYARAGRTNLARQVLEQLKAFSVSGSSVSGQIAFVYLGLGELDQAFVWLERAVASRDADPRALKVDLLWGDLVKNPRYTALLQKFGLDK
ncbi:MAG: tetratricopeptide repeat protein [Verrucomicrobia bacterium]|nr:tetratricopeptide repeat protein [Verrucomicrobiota bacterium]